MSEKTIDARDLFRAAYENRYTWDINFPGYTANITFQENDQVFSGQIKINKDLSSEVFNIQDKEALAQIKSQLWEITIHRVRRSFEDTHSQNFFRYGSVDKKGFVEILMGGKSEGDSYKVYNNEICHVHRHIHGIVVTINTFSSHDTGEGYLSHCYDSIYHDPKTGQVKTEKRDFEDSYHKVGNYYILSNRIIKGQEKENSLIKNFSFSCIELL
ncbi:DUF3386 domain-containing protein [Candidatus Atelocyanobacterium thalassae]|uniref:DUF3386 domain-containing protein n=1 Tax=cyanobacterium endosymbiont of Braarudosphaera bigelowii TaxID=1285375 RepID=A0ABM7U4L7_9CHRO|nr:DUF3386 domain-containing protein [Candidatus Atelocyanobacterium thalassa]BDA39609.1 hypothetical protein CPARK_000044800 [cyanobacterium endosymbiont of Braarudosphaera bigelowii]